MLSFSFHSNQASSYEFQTNEKLGNTSNFANNEILINQTLPNSIENPSTFVSFTKGLFTNSSTSFIVESHKNALFFRYGTNYSVFFTYKTTYDSVDYFPIQNNTNYYGVIISYNKIDHVTQSNRNYVKTYFDISLIGNQGLGPAKNFGDDITGENVLGGVVIGNFNKSTTEPEILVSYIELYTDLNNNEIAQTHLLLLDLNNLSVIEDIWVNNALFIGKKYFFESDIASNIVPAIESNFTSQTSRVDLFSFNNFSNPDFSSAWYPVNYNNIQVKLINNYNNNSYLLIKSNYQTNNFISLLKFTKSFTQIEGNNTSLYDPQEITSNLMVRTLPNGTLCYLIQNKGKNLWMSLDNSIIDVENQPVNTTWIYNGVLFYNNNNNSDLFLTLYSGNRITSFLIQDGSNETNILANISLSDMQDAYLNSEFLIGSFSQIKSNFVVQDQQIVFMYKQNYYRILNNGTTDNVLLFVLPFTGTTINYCNIGFYSLSWSINEYQVQSSMIFTQGFAYTLQNQQNITLVTNPDISDEIYTVNYIVEVLTTNGHQAIDSTTVNFIPTQCPNGSFPIVSQNVVQSSFTGIKIQGLNFIISSIFIVSVLTLTIIYYIDHKRKKMD